MDMGDLLAIQKDSFRAFFQLDVAAGAPRKIEGFEEVIRATFPIESNDIILEYLHYTIEPPKYDPWKCKELGVTFGSNITVRIRMTDRREKSTVEQDVFLGEFPMMTEYGTFVIHGAERIVVSQIHRSPGVFFSLDDRADAYVAKVIPYFGAWLQFEVDRDTGILYARLDRGKRILGSIILKGFGMSGSAELLKAFYELEELAVGQNLIGKTVAEDVADPETGEVFLEAPLEITAEEVALLERQQIQRVMILKGQEDPTFNSFILKTLLKDQTRDTAEALEEIFRYFSPHDTYNPDLGRDLMNAKFYNPTNYDLSRVGRFRLNRRFSLEKPVTQRTLDLEDLMMIVHHLVRLAGGEGRPDDIDHLQNRRVRPVGELLAMYITTGMSRMRRNIVERLDAIERIGSKVKVSDTDEEVREETVLTVDKIKAPQLIVNTRPLTSILNEFFGSSQLSQFMDQTNPLADITHKRRLSALGPGGLSRERAGFEVRDVHYSHYGRVCPIETPEGPNIGLIVSMATYARVNDLGLLVTPYRKVTDSRVTEEVVYLTADEEEKYRIAQANVPLKTGGKFADPMVSVRESGEFRMVPAEDVTHMDVAPKQIVSISTALIPFLEHDDANRALMGSNMQRQAVPLLHPKAPIISTGLEKKVAQDSGYVVLAKNPGKVSYVSSEEVHVETKKRHEEDVRDGRKVIHKKGTPVVDVYEILKYKRSNQGTCINQTAIVRAGEQVQAGQPLADGPATDQGELALGRNVLVALLPWEGYNFEDAVLISEKLVREDVFTSIHIEEFEVVARDTKLGKEQITRDIPNLSKESLSKMDENGIIKVGEQVRSGDILVGKVTPKKEQDMTPELKLLHSIFGEKAKDSRDTSLRLPHGTEGVVIDVHHFSRERKDELPPGIHTMVKVYVAIKRKLSVGDKVAGRHGNKGVVSKICPIEDMPFLPDGTPVDVVLNPLGVPSRMNIGQILEAHLGWAASKLNVQVITPVFDGASAADVSALLKEAKLPETGKTILHDGRTGAPFEQTVTVGNMYVMKLNHLADEKIHARSIGPYSLVTQQPLGGKANFGGQRLGEMEVWAIEAYGAAHMLQEMITIKSDDVLGRAKMYEAIIKGKDQTAPGIPESFNVLMKELQGLGLDIEVLDDKDNPVSLEKLVEDKLSMIR
ncbi:DNA-directed RNA polymerase subunit beta [bacterium]|nr:DNA-directed RNA polymerase subunit beta [bacterium]